jgi:hypothetical protein
MSDLSPIVLFTYLRLDLLKLTIEKLSLNYLASQSDLIIFSDGPHSDDDKQIISDIRTYLRSIRGFKSVSINESLTNKGLASSVIIGVSKVINQYGKVIVLEDDLVTSRNFLNYMNQALFNYENNKRIFSTSGYLLPINISTNDDAFFLNRPWSWGWATWVDRWNGVDWNVNSYSSFSKSKIQQKRFSSLGSDVNMMLKKQMEGYLDSWFIRFAFHQFNMQGFTLFPKISKIINNGWDQFATNTKGIPDRYISNLDISETLNFQFPILTEIDISFQKQFINRLSLKNRIINKLREHYFI